MIRRLVVASLVVVMCLVGIGSSSAQEETIVFKTEDYVYATLQEYEQLTGNKITRFSEAPMLKTLVAAGELPPLEERLPEEPLVIVPVEGIGQYGGALHCPSVGVAGWSDITHGRWGGILRTNTTSTKALPYIAKGYEFSNDYKTLTIYLRKGLKWSDGQLFTVDDLLFWWEDITLNKNLTPVVPLAWNIGGKLPQFEKVDDYTLRMHFAAPCPSKAIALGSSGGWQTYFYDPKHYLKKWHVDYNPEADELARKEGFEHWWEAFEYHRTYAPPIDDPNLPSLGPWKLESVTTNQKVFVRNPYYCAIDTAGNQLPYIDKAIRLILADTELFKMKAVAGEIDFTWRAVTTEDYSLLKKNEEKGGYRTMLTDYPAPFIVALNVNHKDPVLRKIFQDVRFRRAMSLAIHRDEINEVVFSGTGTPTANIPNPSCSFYKEEWRTAWARYDPEEANRLLDEMGLRWDKDHEYRLRPDGKRLSIIVQIASGLPTDLSVIELVKEYWEKVGAKTSIKVCERSFYYTRLDAGEHDAAEWTNDENFEGIILTSPLTYFILGYNPAPAVKWFQYWTTKGKSGEEPPEDVKLYYNRIDEWLTTAPGTPRYTELAHKIFDWVIDQVYYIGIIGTVKWPVVVNKNLRNIAIEGQPYIWASLYMVPYLPEQWYFEK